MDQTEFMHDKGTNRLLDAILAAPATYGISLQTWHARDDADRTVIFMAGQEGDWHIASVFGCQLDRPGLHYNKGESEAIAVAIHHLPDLLHALQSLTSAVSGTTRIIRDSHPQAADEIVKAQDAATSLLAKLLSKGVF